MAIVARGAAVSLLALTPTYRFGSFELQPDQRPLLVDGRTAALGPRAFDVLVALVERAGQLVSKNQLLDLVWPGVVVEENNLQVQVSTLRKVLGPQAIATIPGRGYRLALALDDLHSGVTATTLAPTTTVEPVAGVIPEEPVTASLLRWRVSTNLPLHLPPLFGRENDLSLVQALVREHRLVTLVGAAGIGKTRLAQAVAHQLHDYFSDGVWIVELAPVSDPSLAIVSVAQTLNVRVGGNLAPQDALVEALRDQTLLLVLDNCEHLLEPVAALADALLRSAPGVSLLATSQEPMKLVKEHQFRVGTLGVPADAGAADAADFGAVALFVDRARAVNPRFALTHENMAAVIDICRRLDGIALAIELAAARVPLLGVNGLREKLSECFPLLTAGSRFALRRHQTLHAALDWSHGLLSSPEQMVFRRLGVFVGGFTLEAAQGLAADDAGTDEWSVLDHLGALVDKSLVAVDTGEPPRYRMLETTRAYALERLAEADETNAMVKRHAEVTRRLFERAEEDRFGEQGLLSMDGFIQRLRPELDNLRAALAWSMGDGGDSATALGLAVASAEALSILGLAPEGLRALLTLRHRVEESTDPDLAARYWHALGYLGRDGRIEHQMAIDAIAKAERIYRRGNSPRRLYHTLQRRAWVLADGGQISEVQALLDESLRLEDPGWPGWLRSERLNVQARLCGIAGRHADALALYAEWQALLPESGEELSRFNSMVNQCNALNCLRQHAKAVGVARAIIHRCKEQRLESSHTGFALMQLIAALTALGLLDEAREALREAVPQWRRDGLVLRFCEHIAFLAASLGRHAEAAQLAGAADAYLRHRGIARVPNLERSRAELLKLLAEAQISREHIERWRQEGTQLDAEAVAGLLLDISAA